METGKNKNSLPEGYILHWYEIKRVIGRGGFGITYLAHDTNLDRYVAIKEFMPEDFATRESDSTVHPKTSDQKNLYEWGLERFVKEARTLAKFNHPNIVHVQSVFEENNTAYMIMEYAQGEDLSLIYKKDPKFTEERFLDTFIPVMDGLALIHNAGFIHRDIKPANIYICDNNSPLLLDFGSARQSIGGKTKALTSLVTFGYAPFEQYNEGSGKQGPWTDIYALGASIYVGITGRKPIDALCRGGSFLETGLDTYQPVSVIAKGEYSENFLLAVDNALMFKIDDRPQDIMLWADMLLGKTKAPQLPDYMLAPAVDDKTVIQPRVTKPRQTTAPSQGTQGLVDAHGKRSSTTAATSTATIISEQDKSSSASPALIKTILETISSISDKTVNRLSTLFKNTEKPWLPIAITGAAVVIVLISLSWLFSDSSTPEATPEMTKAAPATQQKPQPQQPDKQLEQLLTNAKQALSQKNTVTPENSSAYYFYQQVLKIEPDNLSAKKGISEIESQLFLQAKNNYDNGDITAARHYLKQLKAVNPDSAKADELKTVIQNNIKNIMKISDLLNEADQRLRNKQYTKPENDNAFYLYQQILKLQADNQPAKQGIKNIEDQLLKLANAAYANKQYSQSLDYLAQLKTVNPESSNAELLKNKINKKQSENTLVSSWLKQAKTHKKNNRYTSPKNNNAFDTYKKILKQEPGNKQALAGIKSIQKHYKSQFNRHIAASQFSKAEHDIRLMKKISAPASTIKQMKTSLRTSQQKQSSTASKTSAAKKKVSKKSTAKTPAPEQLNIHTASKIIGQFKTAIQAHNKNRLINMSQFKTGRKQFVDQLFDNYHRITVKISDLQLIKKENRVKAHVELTELIDNNNNKITPGNWNKFEISVQHNDKKQLKVYW